MTIDLFHVEFLMRVLLSWFLGGIVGWEREQHGKHAGIRTYGSICLAACIFGLVSQSIDYADPARVAAQVVAGIGFICAGVIFKSGDTVEGLTTAAALFAVAAIGLTIAFGMYSIGILSTIILFSTLYMQAMPFWVKVSAKRKRKVLKDKDHK